MGEGTGLPETLVCTVELLDMLEELGTAIFTPTTTNVFGMSFNCCAGILGSTFVCARSHIIGDHELHS
jgi:hypothetical protein